VLFNPQLVQKTMSPSAGFAMASRSPDVILGKRNPLAFDFISKIADVSAMDPSELTLTCALVKWKRNKNSIDSKSTFFILYKYSQKYI
jgi:hypothetical protein